MGIVGHIGARLALGLGLGHVSFKCNSPGEGNVEEATWSNNMGGSEKGKPNK